MATKARKSEDPSLPKLVRVRATRSHDLMDEGQEITTELDEFITSRIAAGYLEVVDGDTDPAASSEDGAASGPGA